MKNKLMLSSFLLTLLIGCSATKIQSSSNEQKPPKMNHTEMYTRFDINKDGRLAKSEINGPLLNDFDKIDTNNNGFISLKELEAAPKPQRGGGNRPPRR